jgi:hypothetical protein
MKRLFLDTTNKQLRFFVASISAFDEDGILHRAVANSRSLASVRTASGRPQLTRAPVGDEEGDPGTGLQVKEATNSGGLVTR